MKLQFGMIVTDAVNSLGGNTVSKNHYGRFARRKVNPLIVRNAYTAAARNNFLFLTQNWRNLTVVQQAAWRAACINYPRNDAFGNIEYPTGQTLYIELNRNLFTSGQALIVTPPVKAIPPGWNVTGVAANSGAGTLLVSYAGTPAPQNEITLIYATKGLSIGINYVSTQYRFIDVQTIIDAGGGNVFSIHAAYVAKFGLLVAGTKLFVKLISVSTAGSQGIIGANSTIVI